MRIFAVLVGLTFVFAAGALAAEFKPYPGARWMRLTTREAGKPRPRAPSSPKRWCLLFT